MSRHILVATDLSPRSGLAAERALFLANLWDATCTFLHVVDDDKPKPLIDLQIGSARDYLDDAILKSGKWGDIQPEILVKTGDSYEVINKIAQEKRSSIIVMGTHRKNILLDVFRGTTVERVLHTGKTQVLMVSKDAEGGYGSAVFGIESDSCSRQAIDVAVSLGLIGDARMTAVHAYQDPATLNMHYSNVESDKIKAHEGLRVNETAESISDFLSSTKLDGRDYNLILENANPAQLITKVSDELAADLIVIGTKSMAGLRKVMLGSVAENVLRHARNDVLVVPPQA
ncbi:MAG: universal stress protein [Micavibrio sp.]|nr:MAG: universal stress protein [Micavibrio sp.]